MGNETSQAQQALEQTEQSYMTSSSSQQSHTERKNNPLDSRRSIPSSLDAGDLSFIAPAPFAKGASRLQQKTKPRTDASLNFLQKSNGVSFWDGASHDDREDQSEVNGQDERAEHRIEDLNEITLKQSQTFQSARRLLHNTTDKSRCLRQPRHEIEWDASQLTELADPRIEKYLLAHEARFRQNSLCLQASEFELLFKKLARTSDQDLIQVTQGVSIYMRCAGTEFDSSLPCFTVEFLFDPRFELDQVVDTLQNEKHRRRWDPLIQNSKVLEVSQSSRLQVVHTQLRPLLNKAPRHFFEKRLHFGVSTDDLTATSLGDDVSSVIKSALKKQSSFTNTPHYNDKRVFYTYASSCAKAPKVPGKMSFQAFVKSTSGQNDQLPNASKEGKTIISMQKFEMVETMSPWRTEDGENTRSGQQVKVTFVSQVDLGDGDDNNDIFVGMMRAPAIFALKQNLTKFYESWGAFLRKTQPTRGN